MSVLRLLKGLGNVLFYTAVITVAIMFILTKAGQGEASLFGYQFKVVLSGSMEPTMQTGSVIAVEPVKSDADIGVQDIVTFITPEEQLVTHRIIEERSEGVFLTKGDNNDAADAELLRSENITATYAGFTIPLLGYLIMFMKSNWGPVVMLIVPGIILIAHAIFTAWSIIRELERKAKGNEAVANQQNKAQEEKQWV
ncbi:signal peptidase I [Bacillaceae bacterium SIJ1]|uniref:signal peptidase I SipW n=1 Tax=Litoribacterium kuwaitense TaxID=1398745 RepID=UPI0013EC5577|nr:signal peptidase I [Litoribacterium kuwaitense]NGP44504.1 signal peptidase I [Litoribacterium kuwaitense]